MDLEKIFDLILQVALKEDLKPEQMIKKLTFIEFKSLEVFNLDNGGNFRPHHHLMEAAIADKEYQTLAVVD
ncbi:hypothetical protein L3X38_027433 [Prunus dulcis]|uniref:DUF7788 domain-containing protein n=1 Tax=Prunus dulcis TaxID=3755 RepID=A0AAD4VQI8_PRUDU|nr:hypothetical protein L3X38_027433 [Prunus dulcis]